MTAWHLYHFFKIFVRGITGYVMPIVLMRNHYHLLIETPDVNLSKGMRQLNGVYTQTFN